MVARLAKNVNGDRRRGLPACQVEQQLGEFDFAGARGALEVSRPLAHGSRLQRAGNEVDHLFASLDAVTPERNPRTAKLLASSTRKLSQKVIEEASEVALAAVKHNDRSIVRESADLLYHLAVLWRRAGVSPADVWAEMRRRADSLGIAEKLPKPAA